jgi:putative tricarboxylic transport membrane protein
MVRHPDLVSGPVIVIVGAATIYFSLQIDTADLTGGLSARFFPLFCGGVLLVAGLAICINGLRAAREPLPFIADARLLTVTGLFLLYFLSFAHVDFRVGAWALMLSGMLALGARRPLTLLLVPILTSAAIYLSFRYGFTILLPTWT